MDKIGEFIDRCGRVITVCRLQEDSYDDVRIFYNDYIACLTNKADFLPYTDSELRLIVSHIGGYFLAAMHGGVIVALSAIDYDKAYGDHIRDVIKNNIAIPSEYSIYEYSGAMVATDYRKAGIAGSMLSILIDHAVAALGSCYLCGIIQITNYNNLKNVFNHGFTLHYIDVMDSVYQLGYTLLPINITIESCSGDIVIKECNIERQVELLKEYIGVDIDNNKYIIYKKNS